MNLADLRGAIRGVDASGAPYEPGGDWGIFRSTIGGYMDRLILRTPWGTVRLHRILREDRDPNPHDHPFDFVSLILWGGYLERLRTVTKRRLPSGATYQVVGFVLVQHNRGTIVRRKAEDAHTIVHVRPGTLTFVVSGPKRRSWGFFVDGTWVAHRAYRARRVPR